jgi:hypothetical protein
VDSLYSAFIIEAGKPHHEMWRLFSYSKSMLVPNTSIVATDAHTNVPRSGDSGLPMSWTMQVDRWRAGANLRFLTDDVLDWAADTGVRLVYNATPIASTPFSDLLMSPHPLSNPSGDYYDRRQRLDRGEAVSPRPLVFRENIGFYVEMMSPKSSIDQLSVFLVENAMKLTDKRDFQEKQKSPRLIGWIWLEGVLSRPVY